jgi:hypothetical protein
MSAPPTSVSERSAAWRRVNDLQAELARRELPALKTAETLAYLQPAFDHAHRTGTPAPTSGLVEQQRWFRLRHGR